jgi:hypothetical protein
MDIVLDKQQLIQEALIHHHFISALYGDIPYQKKVLVDEKVATYFCSLGVEAVLTAIRGGLPPDS